MQELDKLIEMFGKKDAENLIKYPNIADYMLRYYIINEEIDYYGFDFEKNDEILSISSTYNGEHMPHSMRHIDKDAEWAKEKMNALVNETRFPSWFEKEDASMILEKAFLHNSDIMKKVEEWCRDKDIYFRERRQLAFTITSTEILGYCMARGKADNIYPVHSVRVVLDYTTSIYDGPFVIYAYYPIIMGNDYENIINS